MKLHVYQKIIITFILLLLPLYSINVWLNTMGLSVIKEDLSNSINANVQFYSKQLDDQIAFIRNLQQQFLNDSELQKLSFLGQRVSSFDEIQLVNRVRDRLATITNSSNYVLNAGVYLKSFGRTISTQNGVVKLPNKEHETIAPFLAQPRIPLLNFSGDRLFFIETANNNTIVVYLEISTAKLQATLEQLVQYYSDSYALLADSEFLHILSLTPEDSMAELIKENIALQNPDASFDSYLLTKQDALTGKPQGSYRITYSRISNLGLTVYTSINESELTKPLKKFNVWFFILLAASLIVILIFSFSVNWMIHKPLKKLIQAFRVLETDKLNAMVRPNNVNEFGYLYRSFDRMVEKLKDSIQENYEQKISLQHAELKQLQSQINPHFLYNSFFNIYMICKSGDTDSAALLAQKLGSYYQFITRSSKDEAPLSQEYQHALDYCEIQGIRFSNRIEVEAEQLPEKSKPLMVPRIIIQPVVENAFEHAFENGMKRGHVKVSVAFGGENEQLLRITVEDDGDALTDEALETLQQKLANDEHVQEKTGLINVCRRMRLKYGQGSGVFVSRGAMGGLKAEIIIHFKGYGG
ncbi:sensor histidine kinase [Paenibacillus sp. GCM10027626]|uniref:sensor histidine kinase n=1 Tax=Paenibacillus sp. GCM10027626 TaxID=3273411 RepID=UPI0036294F6B